MRPRTFEYFTASSVDEALSLLQTKDEPKILAGGQSLISLMKFRLASPKTLIDINGIKDLKYIRAEDKTIAIGALTPHDQLENDALIRGKLPILSDAASVIADQQVRNRGTIGGSLAHADPTAELPTAVVAANANILIKGPKGSRSIEASHFFQDYFTTALAPDEIIHEIRVPLPEPDSGGAYLKLSRRHGDFAIVSAGAALTIDKNRVCSAASVVLGGVASVPHRARDTEKALIGQRLDDKLVEEASKKASQGLKPPSDVHASSDYRLEMCQVMAKRALNRAIDRASGGR